MAQQLLQDLTYFTPELALAGTFLIAIVMDLIFRRTVWPVAFVVLGGFGLTLLLLFSQSGTEMAIFSNMIAVDPFAFYFKLVIVLCAIFVTVFSMQSSELNMPGRTLGEYYALLPAVALGIVLMAGASNLLMMYLAVELSSVTSYILAGYTKEAPDSSEASLKYIIYGALSSGLMLYGISMSDAIFEVSSARRRRVRAAGSVDCRCAHACWARVQDFGSAVSLLGARRV